MFAVEQLGPGHELADHDTVVEDHGPYLILDRRETELELKPG